MFTETLVGGLFVTSCACGWTATRSRAAGANLARTLHLAVSHPTVRRTP